MLRSELLFSFWVIVRDASFIYSNKPIQSFSKRQEISLDFISQKQFWAAFKHLRVHSESFLIPSREELFGKHVHRKYAMPLYTVESNSSIG